MDYFYFQINVTKNPKIGKKKKSIFFKKTEAELNEIILKRCNISRHFRIYI